MDLKPIDYYVLDALADDYESIDLILADLNSEPPVGWQHLHGKPFTRNEVVAAVFRGIENNCIEACVISSAAGEFIVEQDIRAKRDLAGVWFRLTATGRSTHAEWDPKDR